MTGPGSIEQVQIKCAAGAFFRRGQNAPSAPFPLQCNAISYYYQPALIAHLLFSLSSLFLSQSHRHTTSVHKKATLAIECACWLHRAPSVSILELARPHDYDDVYCISIYHRAKSPLIGYGSRDGGMFRKNERIHLRRRAAAGCLSLRR